MFFMGGCRIGSDTNIGWRCKGPTIMKLGIDFQQFRHSVLRREFERNGYSTILDRVEMADESEASSGFRKAVLRWSRRVPPLKALALTFCEATRFICLK
jgi:hypothetical protein